MTDAKTKEFMRIVKCRPEEVRDIPPGRRWSNPPKREPLFKGGPVLTFGVHKGKRMSEVPKDYLRWILEQPPDSKWFAEAQDEIRRFIGE